VPDFVALMGHRDGSVDEAGQHVEYGLAGDLAAGAHHLGRRQIEPAGEHRESHPQGAFFQRAQVEAPVDQGAQRLLTRQRRRPARGEEPASVVESLEDPATDRVRNRTAANSIANAVEPLARSHHGLRVVLGEREPGRAAAVRSVNRVTASYAASASTKDSGRSGSAADSDGTA